MVDLTYLYLKSLPPVLFLSSLIFFSKSMFLKNSVRNAIRVSNSLIPDQAGRFVGPGLGLNCLQRLLADDTTGQRVNRYGR